MEYLSREYYENLISIIIKYRILLQLNADYEFDSSTFNRLKHSLIVLNVTNLFQWGICLR